MTINPALATGIAAHIGSLEPGKIADIVLWPINAFAAKPALIVKGGLVNWSQMGDPNASIPTPQPVYYRPMFGALGKAVQATRVTFMSQAALDLGVPERIGLHQSGPARVELPIHRQAGHGPQQRHPDDRGGSRDLQGHLDGEPATIEPARTLPLSQLFYLA